MRQTQKLLIVGVGVNGGHGATVNAKCLLQNFGDRRQAIRGAGSIGDHVVFRSVVSVVVDAENKGRVWTIGRRRNNDFLDRSAQMFLRISTLGKKSRGFNDDVRAHRWPSNFTWVFRL